MKRHIFNKTYVNYVRCGKESVVKLFVAYAKIVGALK